MVGKRCALTTFIVMLCAFAVTAIGSPRQAMAQAGDDKSATMVKKDSLNEQVNVETPPKHGFRGNFGLSFRNYPLGASVFSDLAYRYKLFDSDSILLKDTYIEAGAHILASPAYVRPGAYVEIVPLSILQVRSTVYYGYYFGTFGFLYVPTNQDDPNWNVDDFLDAADAGAGQAGSALIVKTRIIPRIRLGRFVSFFEVRHIYMDSQEEGYYYEPYYDQLFRGNDQTWTFKPTAALLSYIGDDGDYLLTGVRWERHWMQAADLRSDQLMLLSVWGMPKSWGGDKVDYSLAALYGYWLDHPNARKRSFFLSAQFTANFGKMR